MSRWVLLFVLPPILQMRKMKFVVICLQWWNLTLQALVLLMLRTQKGPVWKSLHISALEVDYSIWFL